MVMGVESGGGGAWLQLYKGSGSKCGGESGGEMVVHIVVAAAMVATVE